MRGDASPPGSLLRTGRLTSFKFLVLEGLQGQSLDQVLAASGGRVAPQEACRIVRQAALGLGQLHQGGHVRGDIRPSALWMEPGGNIKLPHNPTVHPAPMDLRSLDPSNRLLALADFLAPELLQTEKAPDALTDIYALGCTLYMLLAGQPPFPAGSVTQKMSRHATEPISPLDTTFGVPQPIAQIVSYMMAKNAAVRYQSAVDVANALGPYVDRSVVTPLPALAVPTLPAYESAIMAKRARQATRATAASPTPIQTPSAATGSPVAIMPAVPGGPTASGGPATGSQREAAPGEAAATDSAHVPQEPTPKPGRVEQMADAAKPAHRRRSGRHRCDDRGPCDLHVVFVETVAGRPGRTTSRLRGHAPRRFSRPRQRCRNRTRQGSSSRYHLLPSRGSTPRDHRGNKCRLSLRERTRLSRRGCEKIVRRPF